MESKECKCTFAQSLVGDGCEVCNPKFVIELLKEQNDTLIEQNRKLIDFVKWVSEMDYSRSAVNMCAYNAVQKAKQTLKDTEDGK